MADKILLIGGPGPAVVIANAITHAITNYNMNVELAGLVNDEVEKKSFNGIPIKGSLNDIDNLVKEGYKFIYTIYKIGGQDKRIQLFNSLNIPIKQLYTFTHPSAYVAPDVVLEPGVVVMPNVSISAGTVIGKGTLIMTNASIGHDNEIESHCMFTANACLGSYIKVGRGAWVGLNSTIRGKLTLGDKSAVGIGSVVTKSIPGEELWIGNPAKFHKSVKAQNISM
jgi:sugar O-acyltransferase (sialic acid O-acetyltransferase NeuD family)